MLKVLKNVGITIGVLVLDVCVVFGEFAGSRWVLPWLNRANPAVMYLAGVLLLLLIPRRSRQIGAAGLIACATFFGLTFVAATFVVEADLGGLFGPIVAVLSFGAVIPLLAIITALGQGEWITLWHLLAELALACTSFILAGRCWQASASSED